MLVFETVVLVILGIVVGAELVNVFMLGRLMRSVGPLLVLLLKRGHKQDRCSEQHPTAEGRGPFATAAGW